MKINGGKAGFMALISTHPPLEVRIAALQQADPPLKANLPQSHEFTSGAVDLGGPL